FLLSYMTCDLQVSSIYIFFLSYPKPEIPGGDATFMNPVQKAVRGLLDWVHECRVSCLRRKILTFTPPGKSGCASLFCTQEDREAACRGSLYAAQDQHEGN